MKVLLFSPLPTSTGGIATWTTQFFKEAEAKHIDYDIVPTNRLTGSFRQLRRTRLIFRTMNKFLKSGKQYDIAHINCSGARFGIIRDYLIAKKLYRLGIPIVLDLHGGTFIIEHMKTHRIFRWYMRKFIAVAEKLLVLNDEVYASLDGSSKTNIAKLPNGIGDEFFIESPKHINPRALKFVTVARATKAKGIDELLEAAESLTEYSFDIIGPYDEGKYHSNNNVHFLGRKNPTEIRAALNDSDVFLLPTHGEGFSIALLEAMAMGMPIITTNVGANVEMIEDQGGLTIPLNSPDGIINAAKEIQDPNLRTRMSAWNREKAKTKYSQSKVFGDLFQIYESIISNA